MREAPHSGFGYQEPASPAAFDVFAVGPQPDVYVYRDTGEPEDPPAPSVSAAAEADEREAAYWYGIAEPEQPRPEPEARGPFEPLVSSSPDGSPEAPAAEAPAADEPEEVVDPHVAKSEKLERIKDLYLTAEAIGEENVDKHFDLLLAQQRELISQYFKQPGIKAVMPDAAAQDAAVADAPATGHDHGSKAVTIPANDP